MLKAVTTLAGSLFGMGRRRTNAALIERLHGEIVAASRRPALYEDMHVPDTVEGRFEMLVLHAGLVLLALEKLGKSGDQRARDLAADLSEALFLHLDRGLRESGVGDLAVPKRIKKMAEGFYGRLTRYEEALERGGRAALEAALARNVLGPDVPPERAAALADHARRIHAALSSASFETFVPGPVPFPAA